jgi:hypothetical protein
MAKTPKTRAEQLADAAQKIAKANHYMVGFVDIDGISVEDFEDANQVLIAREHVELTKHGKSGILSSFNLAFMVLAQACFKAHRVNLSH